MIQTHYIFQQNNNMVGRKNMDLLFKSKYYVKHTEKLIHLSTVVILQSMFKKKHDSGESNKQTKHLYKKIKIILITFNQNDKDIS